MIRLVVLALALAACSSKSTTPGGREDARMAGSQTRTTPADQPTVSFDTPKGEVTVTVEIVSTPAKIARGLMHREFLAPDAGMLFLMGEEREWPFYMRNTLIPLDMIFIASDFTVVGIVENAVPRTETNRTVGKPSLYVLEVNGGWSATHGVRAGMKARFAHVRPE